VNYRSVIQIMRERIGQANRKALSNFPTRRQA
jgi:hypothetical protein